MSAGCVIERLFIVVWAWVNALPVNDPLVHCGVSAIVHNPVMRIQILVCGTKPVSMIQNIRPPCDKFSLDISCKPS